MVIILLCLIRDALIIVIEVAWLSSCHQIVSEAKLLNDLRTFHCDNCLVCGIVHTCLRVSNVHLYFLNSSCPLHFEFAAC